MLALPSILVATDQVSAAAATSGSPTPHPAVLALLDDLAALEHALQPWEQRLKASMPGPWTFPQAQSGPDMVPFPLQFLSIETCTLFNLHWLSQLLLHETRHRLLRHVPDLAATTTNPAVFPDPATSEFASLICRSVQFCTAGKAFASAENMFLPLRVVAGFYIRCGDEERTRWCFAAFERIAAEQKIGFSAEMFGLGEGGGG